jgi:hypothetical protein
MEDGGEREEGLLEGDDDREEEEGLPEGEVSVRLAVESDGMPPPSIAWLQKKQIPRAMDGSQEKRECFLHGRRQAEQK